MNVERALKISKIVHDLCKDVPHDIGITIENEIQKYEEWKNFKDEQPNDDGLYLVTWRNKVFEAFYDNDDKTWDTDTGHDLNISHWKNKPEPAVI